MKTVNVADLEHAITHYLELAEEEDIIILKNGTPIGVLRGFADADDHFDYRLETHPLFLERVRRARQQFRAGSSTRLEDIRDELLGDEATE